MGFFSNIGGMFKRQDSKQDLLNAGYRVRRSRDRNRTYGTTYQLNMTQLAHLYRFNKLVRRLIDVQTKPAARHIPSFSGPDSEKYEQLYKDSGIMREGKKGLDWALLFGHGAILMDWDDRLELDQPLQIRRTSKLNGVKAWDKRTIRPLDPMAGAQSEFYQLFSPTRSVSTVHRSRLLIFDGEQLDELSRMQNGGCNESYIQQISNSISDMYQAWDNAGYVLEVFSILDYAIDNMDSLVANDEQGFQSKIDTLDMFRHLSRMFAHDSKDTINYKSMNLSNYDGVFQLLIQKLSMETGIPLTVLAGQSAKGTMGESGRSEREQMTGIIEDLRSEKLNGNLDYFNSLLSVAYKLQPTKYEHAPAVSPDPERQAKIKETMSRVHATNMASGIYGAKTAQGQIKGGSATDIEIHPDEDAEAMDAMIGDPELDPDTVEGAA